MSHYTINRRRFLKLLSTAGITTAGLGALTTSNPWLAQWLQSESASLIAGDSIGSGAVPIRLRKMNADGDASDSGAPIFLEFSGTADIDSEFGIDVALSETANLGGLTLSTVLSQSQAGADQAANQEDAEEVDWAAYSEDITLYEINNEGTKLPDQEEVDEFAKIEGDEAAVPIAQNR